MSYLQSHRLNESAKWLGQLLLEIRCEKKEAETEYIELCDQVGDESFNKVFFEHPNSALDYLNVARILFDDKEYQNCANLLQSYCLPTT